MVTLSSMWERIQSDIFPYLEEELGELTAKQQKLVSVLEVIRIEDAVFYEYRTGRHKSDRKAIARAFVAKAIYNMSLMRPRLLIGRTLLSRKMDSGLIRAREPMERMAQATKAQSARKYSKIIG